MIYLGQKIYEQSGIGQVWKQRDIGMVIDMGTVRNQRLRILYLLKILQEKTDDNHGLTMVEIRTELGHYGIDADRKTIYADIEGLQHFGVDIIGVRRDNTYYYHVGGREFELAELKLLVDSVQSAKFITEKKSRQLIRKIEGLASEYEGKQLQRQVYVSGRIKASNESIYYSVDKIHEAISCNSKVRFQYFQWNVKKQQELRHNGKWYCISPWALSWDDENYYLIGYDSEVKEIRHYRVDKMLGLEVMREKRDGGECFRRFDITEYSKKIFGMFDGEEELVSLRLENRLAGVIIDRFGREITFFTSDNDHFEVKVKVAVSRQFLGWLIALGDGVEVMGPETVVEKIRQIGTEIKRKYH